MDSRVEGVSSMIILSCICFIRLLIALFHQCIRAAQVWQCPGVPNASMTLSMHKQLLYDAHSFWCTGTIWGHRTGSTLVQVMPCLLMAPNHHVLTYHRFGPLTFICGRSRYLTHQSLNSAYFIKITQIPKELNASSPQILSIWHHAHCNNWSRMTNICVTKLCHHSSDKGLSPGGSQTIFWSSAEILLTEPLGTNFNEIYIVIHKLSLIKCIWKVVCKMAVILSQPQCVHSYHCSS